MATAVKKAHKDMEKLVDLFLSPDFDIYGPQRQGGSYDDDDLEYEGEVIEEPESPDVRLRVKQGANFKHNEVFLKACGRKLSKMGDDFLNRKGNPELVADETISSSLQRASKSKDYESEAWESFKGHLDKALLESDGKDAYRTLGAVLLVAKGLTTVGGGVSQLARRFTMRFITEVGLDSDIQRIGGLEGLMRHEVD